MIIDSLLDTDLYKFTMMLVVLHHFPGAQVEYRFKCRNSDIDLTPYIDEIRDEVRALCRLRFRPGELDYLRRVFGTRIKIYPSGGHLGNLEYRDNMAFLIDRLRSATW